MIQELLRQGAENSTSNLELQNLTGLSHRDIVAAVSRERKQGAPILSTTSGKGGYFMPDTDPEKARREIGACIRTIKRRAIHTFIALPTLEKEAERLDNLLSGQIECDYALLTDGIPDINEIAEGIPDVNELIEKI